MAEEKNQSVNAKAEFHEHLGRRWPVLLMYGVAAFLIASAVVFGGRTVYRKVNNDTPSVKVQPADTKKLPNPPPTSKQPSNSAVTPNPASPPPATTPLPNTGG